MTSGFQNLNNWNTTGDIEDEIFSFVKVTRRLPIRASEVYIDMAGLFYDNKTSDARNSETGCRENGNKEGRF